MNGYELANLITHSRDAQSARSMFQLSESIMEHLAYFSDPETRDLVTHAHVAVKTLSKHLSDKDQRNQNDARKQLENVYLTAEEAVKVLVVVLSQRPEYPVFLYARARAKASDVVGLAALEMGGFYTILDAGAVDWEGLKLGECPEFLGEPDECLPYVVNFESLDLATPAIRANFFELATRRSLGRYTMPANVIVVGSVGADGFSGFRTMLAHSSHFRLAD